MLTRLDMAGFKSFVDAGVDLAPVTMLVGANAAGKSNLIDAVRFLQGLAFGMTVADVLRGRWEGGRRTWPGLRGGAADAATAGRRTFGITSRWDVDGEVLTHRIGVELGEHPRVRHESLRSGSVPGYLFDTDAPALGSWAGRHGDNLHVALKRRGRGNSPTQTHSAARSLLGQIDVAAPVRPEVGEGARAVVAAMRAARFVEITPSRMRSYVPRQVEELGTQGENLSAVAWSLCRDPDVRRDLVDWLAELCVPELEDVDFEETGLGDVMLVLVERGGRRIPARSLSDGTLRFLGELVALRTAPAGALLLMEEVENGLHPTRVHLLVEAMESAAEARGIQVIATTHSPLVLSALSEDALRRAVLAARPPGSDGTILRRLEELSGFDRIRERRGVDRLFVSGWLERAA